jgi:CubicO group peptidase (beta-lactamase class C family)
LKKVVLLLVLFTVVFAGCRAPEKDPFEAVREQIEQLVAEGTDPSLAVAVARNGEIIWEEGFGYAGREQNIPATEHTVYNLSSVSKPLTATGLMVLVERGLIDLDGPVNGHLGDSQLHSCVGDVTEAATIRGLADHTAGLPNHSLFVYSEQPLEPLPMEEVILRHGNLVSVPGERWLFSNLGYGVLGQVISEQSGKSFEEFMREEVFLPLGMTHTSVGIDPGRAEHQAVQYNPDLLALPPRTYDTPAGLGIYSSAHDLIRFAMFHLKNDLPDQKTIVSEATLDEMQRPTAAPYNAGYGIGWFVVDGEDGLRRVSHSGATAGASANLVLLPEEDLAVVVLSNTSSNSHEDITNDILAALLPDKFVPQDMFGAKDEPPLSLDPELVGLWQGLIFTHRGEIPLVLEIYEGGEPVVVQLGLTGEQKAMLNDVSYVDDSLFFQSSGSGPFLRGCFSGNLGTEEMIWLPPVGLCFELKLREDTLTGSLLAVSSSEQRGGYSLSHCVLLWKD